MQSTNSAICTYNLPLGDTVSGVDDQDDSNRQSNNQGDEISLFVMKKRLCKMEVQMVCMTTKFKKFEAKHGMNTAWE